MSSISVNPTASSLSLLTAAGNPLANVATQVPQSVLNSASPSDLATLSVAAMSQSLTDALFGGTSQDSSQSVDPTLAILDAVYGLPAPSQTNTGLLDPLATTATDPALQILGAAYGLNAGQSATTSTPSLPSQLASLIGNGNSVNLLG